MRKQRLDLTAGELIVFTAGVYSDYSLVGQFVVLRNVTVDEVRAVSAEVHAIDDDFLDKHEAFVAGLIRIGALASINMREIHLGTYDELDVS